MQDAAHDTEMQRWFAPGGGLSQAIPNFHARAAQRDMAQAIFAAIENNDTLIVEAGTGTGKTYAYLVPALLHGGKVIISTGTKNLQDQLFARDLPTIRKALAVPVSVALLKGRANYVCHYHLERAQDTGLFAARQDIVALRAIVQFSKLSQTGDKADLAEVPENSPVWSKVTSTRDNCLGSDCPSYQKCFVMQARRSAQQADVVVVNHHLFFADLLLKDTGMADLLPNANTIIFDEAHQLPEIATLFFGETLSTSQLLELCRDTVVEGLAQARDAYPWAELAAQLEYAARDCRLSLGEANQKVAAIQLPTDSPFFASIVKIKKSLSDLTQALVQQAQRSEGLQNCAQRGQDLLGKLAGWSDKIEVSDASGTV
ncbi:MAG: ATP-dependent DNA helicase, partial [Ottowia sp.]|nr:ATP-dependent DNA helicase [Ottowia sp.]